jgi:uncharacterized protein
MSSSGDSASFAPVGSSNRIESLDILRGIAVLGILMMNITAFGQLWQAYGNPLVAGGADGWNMASYQIVNVLFEGTMRGIFSLLFGASIILLPQRMEQAGAGLMAAEIHFRRMLWMLLFGIIHWALLLWTGEILFNYALCGLLLFSVRKLSPRILLAAALILLALATALSFADYRHSVATEAAAASARIQASSGVPLTPDQQAAIDEVDEARSYHFPTEEDSAEQIAWHTGSYVDAVAGQFEFAYGFQWTDAPRWLFFDMIPFMLIGMAFLRWGVLDASLGWRTYLAMTVGGYAIGIMLGLYELNIVLEGGFSVVASEQASTTYQISRLAMVIGHLGLFLSLIRLGTSGLLARALAATGQMALSNYLIQTLICTTLFYSFGFGLGLFNSFQRYELYIVVAAIWLAQLIYSPLWLRHFKFGPFEWLWRSLTYWQLQPMRR